MLFHLDAYKRIIGLWHRNSPSGQLQSLWQDDGVYQFSMLNRELEMLHSMRLLFDLTVPSSAGRPPCKAVHNCMRNWKNVKKRNKQSYRFFPSERSLVAMEHSIVQIFLDLCHSSLTEEQLTAGKRRDCCATLTFVCGALHQCVSAGCVSIRCSSLYCTLESLQCPHEHRSRTTYVCRGTSTNRTSEPAVLIFVFDFFVNSFFHFRSSR